MVAMLDCNCGISIFIYNLHLGVNAKLVFELKQGIDGGLSTNS
jgi:hypothetical protein